MEDRVAKIGATLETIKSLKDGSVQLVFESLEMKPENTAKIFDLRQKFGWLLFAPESESFIVAPDSPPPQAYDETKSPQQRLRNTMYRYWEQYRPSEDFEVFYRNHIEKIINQFKEKLG